MVLVETRSRNLGLGEWAVSSDPGDVLVSLGLGSCVAFVVYDAVARVGGMAHMVLPDSSMARSATTSPAKFVDLAIPLVVQEMEARGAKTMRMRVHLVGGARMLQSTRASESMNIGDRNAEAARLAVTAAHLHIAGEELGGSHGRTVRLEIATGEMTVSTAGAGRTAA